jgi:hypothetical protein
MRHCLIASSTNRAPSSKRSAVAVAMFAGVEGISRGGDLLRALGTLAPPDKERPLTDGIDY